MIQKQVEKITQIAMDEPTEKNLAIAAEANQRYIEYLEALEDVINVNASVTVMVDGVKIRFKSVEDLAEWITTSDK